MPYGLASASSVFQSMINDVLRDNLNKFVIAYIDYIDIFPRLHHSRPEGAQGITKALAVSTVHKEETAFLGYNISAQGEHMNGQKGIAVLRWPCPKTLKELKILGVCKLLPQIH